MIRCFVTEHAGGLETGEGRRQLAGVAEQHRDDAVAAVTLAGEQDAGQDLSHHLVLVRVDRVGPAAAARVAPFACRGVTEIAKDRRPQAG